MEKKKWTGQMDRRSFMKYSLSAGGSLMLGSGVLGLLRPVGVAASDAPIKITYTYGVRPDHTELARMVALAFKKVGIELTIEPLEIGAFLSKTMMKHMAEAAELKWSGGNDRIDPSFFLTEFFHSKAAKKRGRNYQHYRNPEYDKICDAANAEMDVDKRVKLVHKCQEILARDYALFPIGFTDIVNAYNKQDWEGGVSMMGASMGWDFGFWTWVNLKPKTKRTKPVRCGIEAIRNLSLGGRSAYTTSYLRLMYDTFMRLGPDLKPAPWAAKSWKIVNNTTIDIVLREGMKFHDGKPVTMEDVKFTFDYIKDRKMTMYRSIYNVIEKTEVLDGNRFRFHLVHPYAPFLPKTLVFAHILPKHIWEKISDPDKYPNEKPMGSGPFKFGYWKKGEELYLEANKEHFHAPKIDGFYRRVIPTMEGIISAMRRKEMDFHTDRLNQEQAEELSKYPHLGIDAAPDPGPYEMRGDIDKKPFSDFAFRKAVSHLIPRKDFLDLWYGNIGHAAANTILHPENKPWYNPNMPFDEYDIDKAKAILKKAGYTWDKKGYLHYPG